MARSPQRMLPFKDYSGLYQSCDEATRRMWGLFTVTLLPSGEYSMDWERTPRWYVGDKPFIKTARNMRFHVDEDDGPFRWVLCYPEELRLPHGA